MGGEPFGMGERDRRRPDRGDRRGIERDEAGPLHEIEHRQARREARPAAGRQDMVRARDIVADRFGRVATISTADIDDANRWFSRYGRLTVLFGRLIPAIRTLISIPAGLASMPFTPFVACTAIGSFVWTLILTASGYVLHESYSIVEAWIDPATKVIVVALVGIYLYRFVTWKRSDA